MVSPISTGAEGRRSLLLRVLALLAAAGFLVSLYYLLVPERKLNTELVAATDHSPPFQIVYPDGRIGGAVVEAINLASARVGIKIRWVRKDARPDDLLRDLDSGVDLWPMITVTPDRKASFHLTQPIGRAEYMIAAIDDGNIQLRDFKPARVALTAGPWIRGRLAAEFPDATAVVVKSGQQLIEVCEGRADALVADAAVMYSMAMQQPPSCAGKHLINRLLVNWYWDLAIGSTFAKAAEADRIRAEFGHLARTGALHELFADYPIQAQYRSEDTFAETRSERDTRHARMTLVGLCICCVALLGIVAETNRRTAQAMRLVKLKSDFLDRMSHELRTPLNGVMGLASLLATTPLTAQQHDYLRLIRQSGEELLKLVSDSLALSRLTAKKRDAQTDTFCPRKLVEDTVAVLAPLAEAKHLDLVWMVARDVPRLVLGDEGAMRQLLINLAGNALKYTACGTVRVCVRVIGLHTQYPFLRCEVDDSGPGIPKEDRARIFESFVRLHRPQDHKAVGTGLGLAIARELVFVLNGKIGVVDSPYGGARFWFEFPVERASSFIKKGGRKVEIPVLTPHKSEDGLADTEASASPAASTKLSAKLPSLPAEPDRPLPKHPLPGTAIRPRSAHLVWAGGNGSLSASDFDIGEHDSNNDVAPEGCAGCGVRTEPKEATEERNRALLDLRKLARATAAAKEERGAAALQVLAPNQEGAALPDSLEMLAQYLEIEGVRLTISHSISEALHHALSGGTTDFVVIEGLRPGKPLQSVVASLRDAYGDVALPVVVLCPAMAGSGTCSGLRPPYSRVLRRPFLSTSFAQAIEELEKERAAILTSGLHLGKTQFPVHDLEMHYCPASARAPATDITGAEQIPRDAPALGADDSGSSDVQTGDNDWKPEKRVGVNRPGAARALVADDNPVNRLVLMSMLRSLGVESDGVSDGYQALSSCERVEYDFVILDHHMPNLDGVSAARVLRSCDDWRCTAPIVASSAANLSLNEKRYRDAGIDAVLPKPFTLDELRATLKQAAGQYRSRVSGTAQQESAPVG
ncbi:MAG: transporter substrate-binding domain-containing protein [Bryobacterales bacterium]|nr:transporter substrate-binding domain-containing protein [Bryobacterales bacterium]